MIRGTAVQGQPMTAGITYDLAEEYRAQGYDEEQVAELDSEETVAAIEGALRSLGYVTERIGNLMSLTRRVAGCRTWDIVFNIAEGVRGMGRESAVPALLDAVGVPYTFSDPAVHALTLHKAMAKRVLRDCGVPTAPFAEARNPGELEAVSLAFPLFVKPVAEGTGKGIGPGSLVSDRGALVAYGEDLLRRFGQPVLVERYLPGREFTVGLLGTGANAEAPAVMEVVFLEEAESAAYTFHNKKHYRSTVSYRLAEGEDADSCRSVALRAWQLLGCRDGGRVDVRMDEHGEPNIMEINT
ncbi:MAG: D-alanine--D-alanine ligase family protein, partial [Spirochaetota bacterium]